MAASSNSKGMEEKKTPNNDLYPANYLIEAAKKGNMDEFLSILDKYSELTVNSLDQYNRSAIMCAAKNGKRVFVKKLISLPSHPDYSILDPEGVSIIVLADKKGWTEIVQIISDHMMNDYMMENPY